MIGMNRIEALEEARADLRDLALVLSRVATDSGERVPFDDLLGTFGLSARSSTPFPTKTESGNQLDEERGAPGGGRLIKTSRA